MSRTWTCLAFACRHLPPVAALFLSGSLALPAARAQSNAGKDETALVMASLERLSRMAREEIRRFDQDHPDPPALAARLEGDPARIFEYVRDKVATEPYEGVLRGAHGALEAGAASPADKALLLSAMLESAGVSCRLVRGELADPDARALVERFLAADPLSGPLGGMLQAGGSPDALDDFCRRSGLARDKVEPFFTGRESEATKLFEGVARQAAEEAAYIEKQLAQAGHTLGRDADAWTRILTERVRRHVWVQAARPDGTWEDLDPSFPDAERGKAGATNPAPVASADLPRHRVELTLRLFRGEPSKPEAVDLLNVPIEAAVAGAKGIDLAIVPADDLPSPSKMMEMPEAERLKLLARVKRFQAILRVGTESFASMVFDLDGNVMTVSSDGRIEGAAKVGGAVGGALGGALGGIGASEAQGPPSRFVRLEAVVGIERPGLEAQVSRRVLLEKADLSSEPPLSPILEWGVLVQNRFVPAQVIMRGILEHQVLAIEPILEARRHTSPASAVDRVAGSRPPPFSILLGQLALNRQSALASSVKVAGNVAAMIDGPQVAVIERRLCMAPADGEKCSVGRIDLVNNSVTVVPRAGGDGPAAARVALAQGVFDTVAESALLARASPAGTNRSAIVDLSAARAAAVAFEITLPAGAATLSEMDRAIAAAQDAGRLLLLPKAGPAASWWSLDSGTGSIVGRSRGGAGSAFLEHKMCQRIGTFVLCMTAAAYSASTKTARKDQFANLLKFEACATAMLIGVFGMYSTPAVQGAFHYLSLALGGGFLYASTL